MGYELWAIALSPFAIRIAAMNPEAPRKMNTLFDKETTDALQQLCDETCEAMQLARKSPDLDDLSACLAVALLKIGLATGFVEQRYPGFAKEIEVKRQRVIAALQEEQNQQKH
jgi:hypothetical protein